MSKKPQPKGAVRVFYSYSHKDEKLRDLLQTHLALLKRRKVISGWHDRRIGAGDEWAGQIDEHMKSADIILLLISANFLASNYCYDIELKLAMKRHKAREARVIPVILRPCDLTGVPFGKLQSLPKDRRPVTKWPNRDDAFTDIANGIRLVAEELKAKRQELASPEAVAESVAPPASPKTTASLIPGAPFIGFVARRDEHGRDIVALLNQELAPGKSQPVAIWGPGGTGKTTLASEVARALLGDFRQRVAWVSALGRADFGLHTLLDEVATQLGRADLRRLAPEPKAEHVRALLAAAPSLVVLDNFETIEPAEQARCVNFLATGTGCSALVTTRERVNHDAVKNVGLAAMEMDDAREFWRRLVEQSGRPKAFAKLDADEIIRHCEANPLVIQWVVGQIELAQRPKDALAYLSKGEGDAAERVFDRSFNLKQLGDDGRAALLALSLFTPDASREALAEVSGFGDDLDRINDAVKKMSALWLVETTDGNERLFLRALKYEMAKSRLSKDARADEFRQHYVEHFLRYAQAHAQPTPRNLDALEAEKDNLRGAMDVAFASQDFERVVGIRSTLDNFFFLRGYWNEGVRSGEQAAAAARELKDDGDIAYFTANIAMIRGQRGEYEEARRAYEEVLKICRKLGAEKNVAICLHQLGSIALSRSEMADAQRLYDESLDIMKRLKDESGVAATLHEMGRVAQAQNNLEEARRLYGESLEISRKLDNEYGIATTISQIGIVLLEQGEVDESKIKHEESLSIRRHLGEQRGIATDLHELGRIAYIQGKMEEARRLYNESLEIIKKLGDQRAMAGTLRNLGLLAEREGDKTEAARLFNEALRHYEKLGLNNAETVRADLARIKGELN